MNFSLRNQPKLIHIDNPIYTGDIGIMSLHMQAKLRHIQLIYCVMRGYGCHLRSAQQPTAHSHSLTLTIYCCCCCCGIRATADCAAGNCAAAASCFLRTNTTECQAKRGLVGLAYRLRFAASSTVATWVLPPAS